MSLWTHTQKHTQTHTHIHTHLINNRIILQNIERNESMAAKQPKFLNPRIPKTNISNEKYIQENFIKFQYIFQYTSKKQLFSSTFSSTFFIPVHSSTFQYIPVRVATLITVHTALLFKDTKAMILTVVTFAT